MLRTRRWRLLASQVGITDQSTDSVKHPDDLFACSWQTFQFGCRTINERDLAVSRILPHGFQVGDDVCKGLPAAAATVH